MGRITVRCSNRGVRKIAFGAGLKSPKPRNGYSAAQGAVLAANGQRTKAAKWARQAKKELTAYASGRRKKFTVPLDLAGTAFQKKVWKALLAIPYGETRSYGEIARQVGNPKAARAVGMANHQNPVAIVVPCHRVIASDGRLGGYAAGLQRKSDILEIEKGHA
ncbi:MAG: methylated-DNA--[protein]-cysteine S-methyltransferase [Acidobacteria bacterium]|nr:methylated-DNA--[protein]-cysteine S-methyltransferase [Acidobacteriota bacterium]